MALFNNVSVNSTQKMVGIYDLYATPIHYKQYTDPAYAYDINNCSFINNTSGTPDQIQFTNLPLLTDSNSSYTFNIRGGYGNGMNNIINSVTRTYADYNNIAQQPLKINVGDNYFSNIWTEIYHNDAGGNRVLIGIKRFDVAFSTVGSRNSFVNEDLTEYDAITNSKVFNSGSVPAGSLIFLYDVNGTNPIDPATGNENASFTGVDTDAITFPYNYKIHSDPAFYRDLKTVVVNKSNPLDIATYGVGNYKPTSVINNNGNFIYFKGIYITNYLGQPQKLVIPDGNCTDNKYITISSASKGALKQAVKTAGSDLIIDLGSDADNFFTADDVFILISDDTDRTINVAAKQFDLNSSIGPVNTTATLNFSQYYGSGDHIDVSGTLAAKNFWLMTTDPSTGDKFNSIFGNTEVALHNEYEYYGLGYNLTPDVSGVDNGISATLYDPFIRPVINNSWVFDNTPPAIGSDVILTTGYGTDIYIEYVDNPLVATFSAAASDNSDNGNNNNGLAEVSLQLSYDQTNWTNLNMQNTSGNNYTLSLGALSYPWQSGDIYYRIYLRDIYGNETFSPANQISDVSISEYSSFVIDTTQQDGFLLGGEDLHIRSIIGDPGANSISLKVYNTAHELVRNIPVTSMAEGFRDFYWDGKNDSGNLVEFGTYYIEIAVDGILEKADKNTIFTVKAVKDRPADDEKDCALESAQLDNKDLNYFRQVRNICINGKLDPANEENKFFAALETGVVFYYKTFTPFYKKHLKNDLSDYLVRKTTGGLAELGRAVEFNSFLAKFLNKEDTLQEKIAGR